ncbi:Glycoside hydrolase superfamily [Penicillium expansum]|nr:Glycoside hydrolase superfamily [Penicillium expansum]
MFFPLLIGAGAALAAAVPTNVKQHGSPAVTVRKQVPHNAGAAILAPFVSFSMEFSSFPDFAGNKSKPNRFSNQLLDNLADLQGVKPYIRVGGTTQELALYDPDLKTQINGTVVPSITEDFPWLVSIGPSYFEAYSTWPGVKFSHGFNLGNNTTAGMDALIATAPLACKALSHGNFAHWELGNEPDLYQLIGWRPETWTESDYVTEWLSKSQIIKRQIAKACPGMATDHAYKYIAPSFAGFTRDLDPVKTWEDGLDKNKDIGMNSMHNYMGSADTPGLTLANTLMNHTAIVNSVAPHTNLSRVLNEKALTKDIPYILGEMNSLSHQGQPKLSNSFGAALWGVDFNLYCASQSIGRTHMHQGTNYRYASWQPVQTNKTTIGTKAPYYGNIMVAAMLRGSGGRDHHRDASVQVVNLEMPHETEAAYAAYVDGKLARVAVINMQEHNYTDTASASQRSAATYQFHLPGVSAKPLSVQRLMANGSDAITGISWDGWSYNYELKGGAPVRLHNITVGETVRVNSQGLVELELPYSSAAILNL